MTRAVCPLPSHLRYVRRMCFADSDVVRCAGPYSKRNEVLSSKTDWIAWLSNLMMLHKDLTLRERSS